MEIPQLVSGQTLGHYEIIKQIGTGGMGEVYLANDKILDRKVAVKVLYEKFTQHESNLQRFIQEAKSASGLNHPNILVIHEIGETENAQYIVSEHIEGKTLREFTKDKSLKLSEVLDISIQIAGALSAAHAAHLVHRDIKPENIMIRPDGFVKILDFGLAKLVEQKNRSFINLEAETKKQNQTAKGMILGTVNYMSPEQAKGKKVDERTDIFSFGVVLYEMITGSQPFASDSTNETIAAILKSEPAPLATHVQDVPKELERIVSKTLRKNPKKRYQHIKDLLIDLQELKQELEFEAKLERSIQPNLKELENETTAMYNRDSIRQVATTAEQQNISSSEYITNGIKRHKIATLAGFAILITALAAFGYFKYFAPAPPITSVAVLPFENASGNANLDYLSDGLSESLIDKLSQLPQLKVIARNSSFEFRGENIDIQDVADKLGVQAIVMGKVVQVGDDLTIRVEMIDARENKQIWGERYDRKAADILSIQNEIIHTVSEKLRPRLTDEQETQLAKRGTKNPEALKLYMKGKLTLSQNMKNGNFLSALKYFEQANALDPNFALPYVEIAYIYQRSMWWSLMDPQMAKSKAKASYQKAFEIDPTLPEVHVGLAT